MRTQEAGVLKRGSGAVRGGLVIAALAVAAGPGWAQDANIMEPAAAIEAKLREGTFDVLDTRGSRFRGDRTNRAALQFADGSMMVAKWARAASGGEAFNNQPRYEAAAYELQKLFLDEPDYVVPPTVIRAFPLAWYQRLEPSASATFRGTSSVVVTLQYWLFNVTDEDVWDEDRLASDTAYARHFGDLNILTYLIHHNDQNEGNLLISNDPSSPRVFAVDNGLAFASQASDRGARWRSIRVERLPRRTVERLRMLTEADLAAAVGTVAQFRVDADGVLRSVPITANVSPGYGIREEGDIIQLGLSEREIREMWRRLEDLLEEIDEGEYELF